MVVLRRLQVPPWMLQAITHTHIYDSPQFRVFAGHTESEYLIQRSGIRQGCPLSPYLFVLLMAAMFSDIKARLNTPKQREPIEGIQYSEVLYADDTLIFGNYTCHINLLLKEIQTESCYYNMELNLYKCINLTLNRKQSSIKFADGSLVPANIQPDISVPSLQIMLIMNKKSWTASQQSALATDSNCFGPKRKTPFHGKFKFSIQSFGVSFYMGWKLSNLTSQNFID